MIAPVRIEHLPSALPVAKEKGSVQFAASDEAFFDKIRGHEGKLEVFVFPAGPASDEYPRDYVCIRGIFGGASKCPDPTIRPESTKDDTPWPVYWTLKFIENAEDPAHISSFLTKADNKHSKTPRRPMIAKVDL